MREVLDLVRWDRSRRDGSDVAYYFRGERKAHPDEVSFLSAPQKPGVYYALDRLKHESDIFNEALRAFPEEFAKDRTTFEKLVRMEHYGYPTRLMNVTPKLMTALGMVRSEGYAPNAEDDEQNGYIHVYRVRESRIKYGTSDTVTALSNLARLKSERVTMDDLCYLAAECQNDRAASSGRRDRRRPRNFCATSARCGVCIRWRTTSASTFRSASSSCSDATSRRNDGVMLPSRSHDKISVLAKTESRSLWNRPQPTSQF